MSNFDFTPTPTQAQQIADQMRSQFPTIAPRIANRLVSAVRLASTPGAVSGDPLTGTYVVLSQSNQLGAYQVDISRFATAKSCTCPDHGRNGASIPCKHRLAAYIWSQAALEFHRAPAADIPTLKAATREALFIRDEAWRQVTSHTAEEGYSISETQKYLNAAQEAERIYNQIYRACDIAVSARLALLEEEEYADNTNYTDPITYGIYASIQ